MASINKVFLMGNLTRDVDLRSTAKGTAIATICLAISRKTKDSQETIFVDVFLTGRTAENAEKYLSKGSPVFIEGSLQMNSWTDKDGNKKSKMNVFCENMQFISSASRGSSARPAATEDEEDIPF